MKIKIKKANWSAKLFRQAPKTQCPVCGKWVKINSLEFGYKVIGYANGGPSHGGIACPKCVKKYKKEVKK